MSGVKGKFAVILVCSYQLLKIHTNKKSLWRHTFRHLLTFRCPLSGVQLIFIIKLHKCSNGPCLAAAICMSGGLVEFFRLVSLQHIEPNII